MPDEAYATSSWEHTIDLNGASSNGSNIFSPNVSHTPPTTDPTLPTNSLSSPPRSSSESAGRTSSSKWRDSLSHSTLERRDTITTIHTNPETPNVVEPTFDESVLRMLCGLDVSRLLCAGGLVFGTQDFRLITVLHPAVAGPNQTEHGLMQGEPADRSPLFPDANRFCRRRRFSSRRGPRWRTSMAETCRNSPARRLSSTQ